MSILSRLLQISKAFQQRSATLTAASFWKGWFRGSPTRGLGKPPCRSGSNHEKFLQYFLVDLDLPMLLGCLHARRGKQSRRTRSIPPRHLMRHFGSLNTRKAILTLSGRLHIANTSRQSQKGSNTFEIVMASKESTLAATVDSTWQVSSRSSKQSARSVSPVCAFASTNKES